MTIQEAIKSGKAFRRKKWGKNFYVYAVVSDNFIYSTEGVTAKWEACVSDILADDWEVKP